MLEVTNVVESLCLGYERLAAPRVLHHIISTMVTLVTPAMVTLVPPALMPLWPGDLVEHGLGALQRLLVLAAPQQTLGEAAQHVQVGRVHHVRCNHHHFIIHGVSIVSIVS